MVDIGAQLDDTFQALSHSARRSMLKRLASSDLTVSELAEPLSMSLWAASKHVHILERAGLIRRTVSGRNHICHLEAAPLLSVAEWLQFYEGHWQRSLDALQHLLESKKPKRSKRGKRQ